MNKKKEQPNRASASMLDIGKIPPQAVDMEQAVLGACMLEKEAYFNIAHILNSESFYKGEHQKIYHAISMLANEGKPVDILTVTNFLKEKETLDDVGGPYYIAQLTERVASSANVEYHSHIIHQKYVQREMINFSSRLANVAFMDDYDELENEYITGTERMDQLYTNKSMIKSMTQVAQAHAEAVNKRIADAKKKGLTGIETGLADLNRKTNGWQKNDLVIFAARPGMGKTAVSLHLIKYAAMKGYNPLVFSLEMDDISLYDRMVCGNGNIDSNHMRSGQLSKEELEQYNRSSNELQQLPIWIDDSANADLKHIRAVSRTKHRKGECDMIVIDYLQLVNIPEEKYSRKNREQEVAALSRSLKVLAKELGIPVILLAQLSRAVETRGGSKMPQLSDLRESGAIEQDADKVFFIYRPEYYGFEQDDNGESTKGKMIIRAAKFRSGPLGDITVKYSPDLTRLYDYEPGYDDDNDVAPY